MRWDVGIDLGTEKVRMAEAKQGPMLEEASVLAFRDGRDTPICGGDAAAELYGRTCEGMTVETPLRDGMLENNFTADRMFRWLYRQLDTVNRKRRFNTMISCAPFTRPVQQEALLTAATDAGAGVAALIRSDIAAAVGSGLDIKAPEAKLIVDIGGGKTTATLITFGRIAAFGYLQHGMNRIEERIIRSVRTEHGNRIGKNAAIQLKHTMATALTQAASNANPMSVTGFSICDRMPVRFEVKPDQLLNICEEVVRELVTLCANVMDDAPEELSADMNDTGIILTGGGAHLSGLEQRIGSALEVPCAVAAAPDLAVVRGLNAIMQEPEKYEMAFMDRKNRS